ncbi:MAG TPA: response regulator [Chitinophagaceae bacterium]|nr:response regulator [Chitinophagaceae bacterium]
MLTKLDAKIFLVDDDVLCLNLYKQFLKQLGYNNIFLFDNGNDCLTQLDITKPDIIFLDYNMDELNGIDVLKQIKKFDPSITVLFISGQEDIEIAVNTIKHGALDYIVKSSLSTEKMKSIMERIENLMTPHTAEASDKKSLLKRLFS